MKITRINKIKGHRVFEGFTWPDDLPDFAQYNLIYGWNGSGKTTISNLLRHLQMKEVDDTKEELRMQKEETDLRDRTKDIAPCIVRVFSTLRNSAFSLEPWKVMVERVNLGTTVK